MLIPIVEGRCTIRPNSRNRNERTNGRPGHRELTEIWMRREISEITINIMGRDPDVKYYNVIIYQYNNITMTKIQPRI